MDKVNLCEASNEMLAAARGRQPVPKRVEIPVESRQAAGPASPEVKRAQLEYVADLILELKGMALAQRLTTLAGILDLAHAEAQLRSRG